MLTKKGICESLKHDQLFDRYASMVTDGVLEVHLLPVMQQTNSIDCGIYAIANAVEFLTEEGNPLSNYDVGAMRTHLLKCLELRS